MASLLTSSSTRTLAAGDHLADLLGDLRRIRLQRRQLAAADLVDDDTHDGDHGCTATVAAGHRREETSEDLRQSVYLVFAEHLVVNELVLAKQRGPGLVLPR